MKTEYRFCLEKKDIAHLVKITAETGFFNEDEVSFVRELSTDAFERKDHSDYFFAVCEEEGKIVAFTCYGPSSGTVSSYDLYWIVVASDCQHKGIGKILLQKTEEKIVMKGGKRVYAETSSRDLYMPTRIFYEKTGFFLEAVIKDYYADNDSKLIYTKLLA